MRNLRCLTVHQPWASAIVHGEKRIENRTMEPPATLIGEVLAIHAGKTFDVMGEVILRTELGFNSVDFPDVRGAIIGVGRVIGFFTKANWCLRADHLTPTQRLARIAELRQSPYYAGEFGWILDEVIALPEPVPCRGMQGIWWAERDTVAAVSAQLGEVARAGV